MTEFDNPDPNWPQDQPWYPQCLATVNAMGGTMCPQVHCDATIIKQYSEAYCSCAPGYLNGCAPPNPPPNCCPYTASSPLPIVSLNCFCCCGCFANDTPVAFAEGEYKAIEEFVVGDPLYVADDISLRSWSLMPVKFSSGAGDRSSESTMLKVTYGTPPNTDYLLVSRGEPFLTTDGLVTAAMLVPGKHLLVTGSGGTKPLLSMEVGMFKKGMHHIATSTVAATSPDGHLFLAKGMVCGDWALQIAMNASPSNGPGAAPGLETMPEFGTRAYAEAHPELNHVDFRSSVAEFDEAAIAAAQPPADQFKPFDSADAAYVPDNAYAFFTPEQAWDVVSSAPAYSPASHAGKEIIAYQFKLFRTFYPSIDFFYDERGLLPNAYIFEEYGRMRLVVTGGLARLMCVKYEGLATIIATLVAATMANPPLDKAGLSCLGAASFGVTGVILELWIGLQGAPIITKGIDQITELFSYVSAARQGGTDTCMGVSCDCRIQAMQAAVALLPLPYCAGGPPDPALEVGGATGKTGLPHGSVTISFSLPVDPVSAGEIGNYALDPLAEAFAIEVTDDMTVVLIADLASKTAYSLTVTGVLSSEQQPLMPGKDRATFTTD